MSLAANEDSPHEPQEWTQQWLQAECEATEKCKWLTERDKKSTIKLLVKRHRQALEARAGVAVKVPKAKKGGHAVEGAEGDEGDGGGAGGGEKPEKKKNYWKLCSVVCATGADYEGTKLYIKTSGARILDGCEFYKLEEKGDRHWPGGRAPSGGDNGRFWEFKPKDTVQQDADVPILVYIKKKVAGFAVCIPPGQELLTLQHLKPSNWEEGKSWECPPPDKDGNPVITFHDPPGTDDPADKGESEKKKKEKEEKKKQDEEGGEEKGEEEGEEEGEEGGDDEEKVSVRYSNDTVTIQSRYSHIQSRYIPSLHVTRYITRYVNDTILDTYTIRTTIHQTIHRDTIRYVTRYTFDT